MQNTAYKIKSRADLSGGGEDGESAKKALRMYWNRIMRDPVRPSFPHGSGYIELSNGNSICIICTCISRRKLGVSCVVVSRFFIRKTREGQNQACYLPIILLV